MSVRVYFVRHGETPWNVEHRCQGLSDIPLNENGIAEAQEAAKGLAEAGITWDIAFSSPLKRAKMTADILTEGSGKPLIVDDRLHEMAFGEYEGTVVELINEDESHPMWGFVNAAEKYHPTGDAETYDDVRNRIESFFRDRIYPLADDPDVENVLIIGHGGVIREMLCWVAGWEREGYYHSSHIISNCSVCILECDGGKPVLVAEAKQYGIVKEMATFS